MRDVLAGEAKNLQKKFLHWNVIVVPPILYLGSISCPINGDDMVKAHELGFDEIYVLTKKDRKKKKKKIFKDFPKVQIIGMGDSEVNLNVLLEIFFKKLRKAATTFWIGVKRFMP